MKRILLSLTITGAVLGTAIFATNAFFSDVETSTGNTFQAGKVDLEIKSECSYNGQSSNQCGSWAMKDLSPTADKFFNFSDVKPGDWGENTITFKVINNPSWMCATLGSSAKEKLADYLQVFWWVDTNGDNIYQSTGDIPEKPLFNGVQPLSAYLNISNPLPMTFADASWNWEFGAMWSPIPGNQEKHLGVAWCFGSMTIDPTAPRGFKCDGSGNQNDSQGTKVVADLSFDVVQSRNNETFRCPESLALQRPVQPTPIPQ